MTASVSRQMPDATSVDALSMEGISKSYGTVQVLHDVDFTLRRGEIHGLVGENGAGKSTLVGIIAGDHTDFDGTMSLFGEEVRFANARAAQARGVVLIHQEPTGLPTLSVAENILAGKLPSRFGIVSKRALYARAAAALGELGTTLDVQVPLGQLTPAHRQLVEIARALLQSPKILILDEPTASLDASEAARLFAAMERVRDGGAAILFISHHLPEVLKMCDRVTILRDGRRVATVSSSETTEEALAATMIGRELAEVDRQGQRERALGEVGLAVEGLTVYPRLVDVSFEVRAGEILGVTGLLGAGQDELIRALFGFGMSSGSMRVWGKAYCPKSPSDALASGVALLTDDRQGNGLILDETISKNLALASSLRRPVALYRDRDEETMAKRLIAQLDIVPPRPRQHARALSGGNQQKVALGKWLRGDYRVLLLHEPTRGVDVGAKALIHKEVLRLAEQGMPIVVVSSDLREITALSDRVVVLHRGRIASVVDGKHASEDRLLTLAAGVSESLSETEVQS